MYDLHRLRLLRELKLRGTLAAVAAALGYSPSAVSHQLSTLERETRVQLLEPVGRGVRLTPAALALVEHTEVILAELERAEATVAASRTAVTGTVRVATFQTAAHTLLPVVLTQLASEHPQLTVSAAQVTAESAIPALAARDFDVVLSERYPAQVALRRPGVDTTVLLSDTLQLAVPHEWTAESLVELAGAPWVMEHPDTAARAFVTTLCRAAGFEPEVRFETSDVHLHGHLVRQGLAVAVLPGLGIVEQAGLRLVPLRHERVIEVSTRAGSEHHPGMAAVTTALARHSAAMYLDASSRTRGMP